MDGQLYKGSSSAYYLEKSYDCRVLSAGENKRDIPYPSLGQPRGLPQYESMFIRLSVIFEISVQYT